MTCGRDNRLQLVDPRTFQVCLCASEAAASTPACCTARRAISKRALLCCPLLAKIVTMPSCTLLTAHDNTVTQIMRSLSAPGFAVDSTWCTPSLSADEQHVAAGSVSGALYVWQVLSACLLLCVVAAGEQQLVYCFKTCRAA